ncbi:MAG: protein translocase subunit SecD [Lachnospiraceae bacterium]|nr:protein translocase subunit SecD [Lachnospiraceae bacterium]
MKKNKAVITLLVTVVLTGLLLFTSAVGWGADKAGAAEHIKLGLDLAGGVSITYEAVGEDAPSAEDMSDTIYKLQKRVETYSTEAEVYQEGSDRINIEIPGVTDANRILEDLGKPGSLQFQTMDGAVVLEGTDVADARAGSNTDEFTGNRENVVSLTLTEEGTTKFAVATAANIGSQIAIVYDGEVISAPTVNEAIGGGQAQISGNFTFEEAEQLASTIRIGTLSLELQELRSNVVGAKLGEEAIATSLRAGVIGFLLVILFMILVYRLMGAAAGVALTAYVGLVLGLLNGFEMTLTLPGIAGIILSIGMAVDANVIIFARIREELATGKTVRSSMKIGFQKALSAIVDGNVTTLIAALVLSLKGSGSVKGFAQTLALGIVVSMFTALVVTRLVLNALYALGLQDVKYYGMAKEQKSIDFLGKKKICFAVSLAVIAGGLILMGVNAGSGRGALEYSLEFQGGTSTTVEFPEDMSIEEIDAQVVPVVSEVTGDNDIQTQKVAGTNQVIIKTKELDLAGREALNAKLAETFGVDESTITAENISGAISKEVKNDAIVAVVIATICMLIYIWIRFKDVRFATSAVAALVHDVLVVLAFYAAARVSVGNTFIACMLTIVGYSINATIVIFDRIRENMADMKKKDTLEGMVNASITQTLTRSIYTSLTTFVMVAVLYMLGVASIKEFALPLMVGIVCGAYSSVCITGALWYLMKTKIVKKEA